MVITATRNGYFFVLDRVTGEHLVTGKFGLHNNWALGLDDKLLACATTTDVMLPPGLLSILADIAGKPRTPFKYRDKGTMATIGRGAAVVQMLGGKTMKGMKAQLAWGTVHLALLPTNEDRAKAVVEWAGAGLTHQRTGRISVTADRD